MAKFLKLISDHRGATAIEYALVASLISIAAIAAMQGLGKKIGNTYNGVETCLGDTSTCS